MPLIMIYNNVDGDAAFGVIEREVLVFYRSGSVIREMVEPDGKGLERAQQVGVFFATVVCGAVEMRKVKAEPSNPAPGECQELFRGIAEEVLAGEDGGEVFEDEAGIMMGIEERSECLACCFPPARLVSPGVEHDVGRLEEVCGFVGHHHRFSDQVFHLGGGPGFEGCRGAGVDTKSMMGSVNEDRNFLGVDDLEVLFEQRPLLRDDEELDEVEDPLPVHPGEFSERAGIIRTGACTDAVGTGSLAIHIDQKSGIARSRFELLSRDPESPMIDRYTTGLLDFACLSGSCILIKVTEIPETPILQHALGVPPVPCEQIARDEKWNQL